MKINKIIESEREFRLFYTNAEEEDDYLVTFKYNEESKKWITNLSGEYEEEELEAIKKVMNEINKNHKTPIEFNFEKAKTR